MEGQLAVGHQRQPLPVGRMDGIDHLRLRRDLRTNIFGQICDLPPAGHRRYALPALREGRRRTYSCLHRLLFDRCAMLWTTLSTARSRHRSTCSEGPVLHDALRRPRPLRQEQSCAGRRAPRCRGAGTRFPAGVVGLAATDHQLAILDRDRHVRLRGKPATAKGDAVGVLGHGFDIVGRVAVSPGLRRPLDQPFQLLEAEKDRDAPQN
jgi:hypothetical protein